MVMDNNIYFKLGQTEEVHQMTEDGEKGVVFNGVCDWVYRGQH